MIALLFVRDPLIDSVHYFIKLKYVNLFAYTTKLNEFYVKTLAVDLLIFEEFIFMHFFELALLNYLWVIR